MFKFDALPRATARSILLGSLCALPLVGSMLAATAVQAQTATARDPTEIEEVVVTATRRAEPLSKVAISVSTFSDAELESRGVKNFDDIIRLTPGLNLTRQGQTGASQIAIRGISSNAGSGTTGLYIDDTPIQVRNLGFGAGNAFPGLFDQERIEVLRGPQGTLFGAGSEGGTVRFIQTEPSLTTASTKVRAEVASLKNGSPSYEAGVAFGAPIIDDKLGFRVSAYYRREGGYVDAVGGTYKILDYTGKSYGDSVAFTRTNTFEKDVNWNRTIAFRGALKFKVNDNITITPSVFYQKHHVNDGPGDGGIYDLATSDPRNSNYSRQYYYLGTAGTAYTAPNDPTTTTTLNPIDVPNNQLGDDKFTLSALGFNWDLGPVTLVSNTSFFDRTSTQWYDYTKGYAAFYIPQYFLEPDGVTTTGTYAPNGWKSMALYNNGQKNFIEEIRLQSNDSDARLTWLAGLFFSRNKQTASEPISHNFLANASWVGFYPTNFGYGYYGVKNGDPFGPGSTALQNFFGDNLLANGVSFLGVWETIEKQMAGFTQFDFKVTDRFKLTAGVRVSKNKLEFNAAYLGPENNANAPFGFPCPTPGTCVLGVGASAPVYPTSATSGSETAVTPKFGIAFQLNEANLFYATAAKGFRPAGASLRVPSICDNDLKTNGYVDANGNPVQPQTYKSDSVWSYEIGSKNRLFGGRLVLDGSIYEIKWKNIQANVSLPGCSYNFVDNLADATSRGIDLSFQLKVTERLELSGAYGYSDPKFDKDALSPGGKKIFSKGAGIPDAGAPSTLSLSGEYTMPVFSHEGYVRADFTHTAQWRRVGNQVSTSPLYDERLRPVPSYNVLNARLGARFDKLDVSLFIQNLTNSRPALNLQAGNYYDPQDWQTYTLRPRTYGLTVAWRN